MGIQGAQNPDRELLGHVKDYGESTRDPYVRLYRTSRNIRYHCDAADIDGLLCLYPAKSGGQSRIVSTVTISNELMQERPHLPPRIFEPCRMDLRGEIRPTATPYSLITQSQFAEGQLRTVYHSDYFRSVEWHEGIEFTPAEREIPDFCDEKGLAPSFYLDISLEQGDIQFIYNHFIAHARATYKDNDDPEMKCHLLRLWLYAA